MKIITRQDEKANQKTKGGQSGTRGNSLRFQYKVISQLKKENKMKRLLMITAILLVLGVSISISSAFAENYTVYHVGNNDFIRGSEGYSGSGSRVGSNYFYHDNN